MANKKEPSAADAERCLRLRKQSKQGVRLHPDDMDFLEKMWWEYRDWYGRMSSRVYLETKPFGSNGYGEGEGEGNG